MKKLPKIYQTEILKKINNNKRTCYVKQEELQEEKSSLEELENITLDEIFSGIGYSFNIPLIIKTQTKTYDTSLIARTKYNVVTIDNEMIPISQINEIKKKKN